MRIVRVGIAATLIAVGAYALPATAMSTAPAALGGNTTIVATHSGSIEVALYNDVTLSPNVTSNPDVSLSGKGRFVALWMTRLYEPDPPNGSGGGGDYLSVSRGPAFMGDQVRTHGTDGQNYQCTAWPNASVPLNWNCPTLPKASHIVLHQGFYVLTVLTDGSPLRIRLHLHGQTGRATVSPKTYIKSAEAPLPMNGTVNSTMVSWGASMSGFASDTTVAMQFVSAQVPATSNLSGISSCVRQDDGSGYLFPYGPMCPNGTESGGWYTVSAASFRAGGGWISASTNNSPTGVVGQGGAVWSSAGVTFGQAFGVWMDNPPGLLTA